MLTIIRDEDAFYYFYINYFLFTFRYRGYFADDPSSPGEYKYTMAFWHILAAKLAFVVIFEVSSFFLFKYTKLIGIGLYYFIRYDIPCRGFIKFYGSSFFCDFLKFPLST